ncbi:MAG: hypothetical protein ACRCRZ_02460 [Metamycoplasmataceae bacterium]
MGKAIHNFKKILHYFKKELNQKNIIAIIIYLFIENALAITLIFSLNRSWYDIYSTTSLVFICLFIMVFVFQAWKNNSKKKFSFKELFLVKKNDNLQELTKLEELQISMLNINNKNRKKDLIKINYKFISCIVLFFSLILFVISISFLFQ